MLKEEGKIAEDKSSRKIILEDAQAAVRKAEEVNIRRSDDLEDETSEKDIPAGKDKTFKINFDLPLNLEDDDFK